MTLAQQAAILRSKHWRRAAIARQLQEADTELARVERDYSRSIGMPTLRGDKLLEAMETEIALAKQRERKAGVA